MLIYDIVLLHYIRVFVRKQRIAFWLFLLNPTKLYLPSDVSLLSFPLVLIYLLQRIVFFRKLGTKENVLLCIEPEQFFLLSAAIMKRLMLQTCNNYITLRR